MSKALALVIVTPVFNEEDAIPEVVAEWLQALRALELRFRWIWIDDGSTDRSAEVLARLEAQAPELQIIRQRNQGHGAACLRGYAEALRMAPAWVIQIDSDGQCDPRFFAQFWSARSGVDVVQGYRRVREDGLVRVWVTRLLKLMVLAVSRTAVRDPNVPYRLIQLEALAMALPSIPPASRYPNVLLSILLIREAARIRWVPIVFRKRSQGQSSVRLLNLANHALAMLSELRRFRPEKSRSVPWKRAS